VSVPAGTTFAGARVALLESRLADETAAMVRRLGGDPVNAPSVSEVDVDADQAIAALIDRLSMTRGSVVIFLTGAAVTRVFAVAERLSRATELQVGLTRADLVTRGPKPAGALARRGLTPARAVAEPFTTADVLTALDALPLRDRDVTVVHYGERSVPIVARLADRGARVFELLVYEWRLPWNIDPLSSAIDALTAGDIPVLVLTSQIQVRHLVEVAGDRRGRLIEALNRHVLVGAVGPTCAAACYAAGLRHVVTPTHPKLGPLLQVLAHEWTKRTGLIAARANTHD
jgi:uroporphyrinogen-III synthase